MNKLMPVLFSVLFVSSGLHAQTQCSTDVMGNTVCRDSQTNTKSNADRRTNHSFGNATSRESRESTDRGSSNSINQGMRRDSQSGAARSRNDTLGNTIYRDNRGSTVRCGADSYGDPGCR